MNRRDFLKGLSAAALMMPASALAQTISLDVVDTAKDKVSELFERTFELESVDPDSVEWIEGISDGTQCTF